MRLLHFDPPDTLVLTDFRDKPIPPYAVLSHRWSDSETLLEDVLNGNYTEKGEGYRKLKFCAEQAAKDGLQYFWIDTCCIDRWDKDELSTSINSMFRWYRNAARCYVFLPDVSLTGVTGRVTTSCSDWEAAFCASAWFTRGWTLQELIAPVIVEFFSREGQRIGDKATLEQLIHSITNIPLAALRNGLLEQTSPAERMRWAENRRTTEEEDIVYCLLGILGVSMPVMYGEGQESARRRLQAELETNGSAPTIIPFPRNESFVGRESQVAELEAKLFSDKQTTTRLAIAGSSGTGKSQLALEVAHRTSLKNKDCLVFWMDASDKNSLFRSYANVAQKLRIPGCDNKQADRKLILRRCMAEVSMRQCLLIFDNVENESAQPGDSLSIGQAAYLSAFLPESKLCSAIFTTTGYETAKALAPQNVLALPKLNPAIALRLLRTRLVRPLSVVEEQEAMHLLERLVYSTLAIVQAAAYMKSTGTTVLQYQAQLDEHEEAALNYSNVPSEDELRESYVRSTVAATLSLSISQVRQSNPTAAEYLFRAACIDRKDISLDLLEAASPRAREDAIKVLDRYALVTRRPAELAFDIHRLVHYALRRRLQTEGALKGWNQRTITQLLRVFPNNNHDNRSKWRRLLPHAQYVLSHSQRNEDEERLDLERRCAMALYSDGRYTAAEQLEVQVMETTQRALGDEHPHALSSMANLASIYRDQGRWREAEKLQLHVMRTRMKVLGNEHPDTLFGMAELASNYRDQGLWKQAEELGLQMILTRKKLGSEGPQLLATKGNLALTYLSQGRWKEAKELFVQKVETEKRVYGNEHPRTLSSMTCLAAAYKDQGRWDKAAELELQAMQIRKKVLGDEHPDTLTSMGNLSSTYRYQGRWKEAEELGIQTMQTLKGTLGSEHPCTLSSMANLASTYWEQGHWHKSEELEVQVLEAKRRVFGKEHPSTLATMCNLGMTYGELRRWKEAEELQVRVRETWERQLGVEHPYTLTAMSNLASLYRTQKRWQEAEELDTQATHTRKRVLGDEHPHTLTSLSNLASTYRDQGRWTEAEEIDLQVLETEKRVLGDEHPHTLTSMNNLADTYRNQGRWEEAERLFVQVTHTIGRVFGDEHPKTLKCVSNLALTLHSQGRLDEALVLMERCFQSRQRVLGEQHPQTLASLTNLNTWRAKCNEGAS